MSFWFRDGIKKKRCGSLDRHRLWDVDSPGVERVLGNVFLYASSFKISSILIADKGMRVPGPKIAATPAL